MNGSRVIDDILPILAPAHLLVSGMLVVHPLMLFRPEMSQRLLEGILKMFHLVPVLLLLDGSDC